MDGSFLTSEEALRYVYIPILICLSRILDVSIGTIRIIFVSKGMKKYAPFLGFVEVMIWLMAIGQVMQNLYNPINYIAYGAGFALGNYAGIKIEERLSLGYVLLRVITRKSAFELEEYFRRSGNRFTIIDADSDEGPVNIFFIPIRRKVVKGVIENVKRFNPNAFYTLEDVRSVSGDEASRLSVISRNYPWYGLLTRSKRK